MSTKSMIELYDEYEGAAELRARLYCRCDGYPDEMGPRLHDYLQQAAKHRLIAQHDNWWRSQEVAAILVKLSLEDCDNPLLPYVDRAGDAAYTWKVYFDQPTNLKIKVPKHCRIECEDRKGQPVDLEELGVDIMCAV